MPGANGPCLEQGVGSERFPPTLRFYSSVKMLECPVWREPGQDIKANNTLGAQEPWEPGTGLCGTMAVLGPAADEGTRCTDGS